LLEKIYKDDPLFAQAAQAAADLSGGMGDTMGPQAAGRAPALAGFAADRLNEDTRIAGFSLGGFDTHRNQHVSLPRALKDLQAAILTLREKLGGNWQKTAVLGLTEFGRTVAQNGSKGTDHGTGGVMVMAGGAINGGRVLGNFAGLDEADLFERRDLMPTDDVRRYAGHVMRGLFSVSQSDIERAVFPGLDMSGDPKVLL